MLLSCLDAGVSPLKCSWDTLAPQGDSAAAAGNTDAPSRQQHAQPSSHAQQTAQQSQDRPGRQRMQQHKPQEPLEVEHDLTAELWAQIDSIERVQQDRMWWRMPHIGSQRQPDSQLPQQQQQQQEPAAATSAADTHQQPNIRRSFAADEEELALALADSAAWRRIAERLEHEVKLVKEQLEVS